MDSSSRLERALGALAGWSVAAGRAFGRGAATAYRAVDPDVRRHIAQLPLLGYTLLGARDQAIEQAPDDGHLPLVFVHGLGGSRGDFLLMAKYLALHGRKRSYRVAFEAGVRIDAMASTLAEVCNRICEANGATKLVLVAHSLGGLVTRLAMLEHGLASRLDTVITLGTPHGGTHSARWADTASLRELRPDSPLIEKLGKEPWPKHVRGVSVWSRSDVLVQPAESAALAGTEQLEVTPFTHYSYLVDPRSWVLVREELERGR